MDQEPITDQHQANIEQAGSAMESLMNPETPPPAPPKETPPPAEPPKETPPPADEPPAPPKADEPPPPPADEPPPTEPEDTFDSEVDAISPKSKEAIRILKDKAKAEHGEAKKSRKELADERKARAEIDTRIKELESKVITPELENELNDLRTFRQTYALETDPTVTKPFDDRVSNANTVVEEVMKQIAVPEATQKFINDNGGLYNFRMSDKLMPQAFKNRDGSRMTHAQFYKQYILNNTSEAQREELEDSYREIRKAQRDKSQAIKTLATNKEQYLKTQQEAAERAKQEWIERVGTHSKKVLESYGDDAKLLEVPADATPEQKAAIEQHNQDYRNAEARATQIMREVTPENLVEAAIAAGYVTVLQRKLKSSTDALGAERTRANELQKKLDDIINSGKTSDLAGTTDVPGAPVKAKNAEDAMTQMVGDLP